MRLFLCAFEKAKRVMGNNAHFLFMDKESLQRLVEEVLKSLGFELVDLERSARARLIRVFMENQDHQKPVDTDDCARVSNQLTRVLTVENVDFDRLEVSSPGLDRVVKKLEDFARFEGKPVQIKLKTALESFQNRRHFQGELAGVENGKVVLLMEGHSLFLEFAEIEKARLVPVISFSGSKE